MDQQQAILLELLGWLEAEGIELAAPARTLVLETAEKTANLPPISS